MQKEFQKGASLVEVKPSVPTVPAGRTNMGKNGIPQSIVKGAIKPQEIKIIKQSKND